MTAVAVPAPRENAAADPFHGEAGELLDVVGHQVAAAFEAGGTTWELASPHVRNLVPDNLTDAPAVVLARALGRALARHAVALDRGVDDGDRSSVERFTAQLRGLSGCLADLLGARCGATG